MVVENKDRLNDSFLRYFTSLSKLGKRDYTEVYKLLVYDLIVSLLEGPMSSYVTESDYIAMQELLYCLYGTTCLIPYPEYVTEDDRNKLVSLRITEHDDFRLTESEDLRYTEKGPTLHDF